MESLRIESDTTQTENCVGAQPVLLNATAHCMKRCRQRGIKEEDLDLIMRYGSRIRKPGGVWEYSIGRKEKKAIIRDQGYLGNEKYHIQKLDRLVGMAIIVDEDEGVIITTYHKNN